MSGESEISNRLSTSIDPAQCIFKVHDRLRIHNREAYEPQVLSIGPYHYGKPNLKKMKMHKRRYLDELLLEREETNRDRCISALTELEDRARRCYAEDISEIKKDDFVEMMLLDGCFIIQFLRKLYHSELRNGDDPIFKMGWLHNRIKMDLIVFENQAPFFILEKLFDMTTLSGKEHLTVLVYNFCAYLVDPTGSDYFPKDVVIIHLLDLMHKSVCSSFAETFSITNDHPLDHASVAGKRLLRPTSELKLSGIEFEADRWNPSLLDITFDSGKLIIPCLTVEDHTESVFRNLIAYEEYVLNSQSRRLVSEYTKLLDLLIASPRDVEILSDRQIIRNLLGDDEAVCTMFNKLGHDFKINDFNFRYSRVFKDVKELIREISLNDQMFCYLGVFEELNKYSRRRRNI
ncbi:hypothetical protein ACH5RR_031654 [Cinchona calisaya]|uniref:Uncharacterized protein n=1 Tax=Cinchona calisaya TaxID=153742 RepID=A0ABD2YIW2_9GENT